MPGRGRVVFHSASGPLTVTRADAGYVMDFPVRRSEPVLTPAGLAQALGGAPVEVVADAFNYTAVLESAQVVRQLDPDIAAIAALDRVGVIVTAPGDGAYHFVSRYFALLGQADYDLGKSEFRAFQASPRGGEIVCRLAGDRVELEGACVFYLEGEVEM